MVSWFYQYYYLCASIGGGHDRRWRGDLAQFSKNQKPFLRTTPTLNIWEAGAGGVGVSGLEPWDLLNVRGES